MGGSLKTATDEREMVWAGAKAEAPATRARKATANFILTKNLIRQKIVTP